MCSYWLRSYSKLNYHLLSVTLAILNILRVLPRYIPVCSLFTDTQTRMIREMLRYIYNTHRRWVTHGALRVLKQAWGSDGYKKKKKKNNWFLAVSLTDGLISRTATSVAHEKVLWLRCWLVICGMVMLLNVKIWAMKYTERYRAFLRVSFAQIKHVLSSDRFAMCSQCR